MKNETFKTGECSYVDSPDGRPWCYIEIEEAKASLETWDYCNDNCGMCMSIFPFKSTL